MIQCLGAHASKECIKDLRQFTNLFQILLQNPRTFELDSRCLVDSFKEYLTEVSDAHFVVHGPYNTNILIDNKVIKPSIACIKAHLEACSYFGVKHLVIHPGTRHFVSKTEDREVPLEESIRYVRGVLSKMQPFIASRGVKLLLENMSNTKMKGMPTEVLIQLAQEFSPHVGVCFDCVKRNTKVEMESGSIEISSLYSMFKKGKDLPSIFTSVGGRKVLGKVSFVGRREMKKGEWVYEVDSFVGKVVTSGEHVFFGPGGEIKAKELKDGDQVYTALPGLTDKQEQFLYGTLLGDSYLSWTSGKIRVGLGNCDKQKEYLDGKVKILRGFFSREAKYCLNGRGVLRKNGERCINWKIMTSVSPEFERIRSVVYEGKRRKFNRRWMEKFTDLSLAAWFFDDGSMQVRRGKNKNNLFAVFHCQGRTYGECLLIQEMFSEKFGLRASLKKYTKGFQFCLGDASARKLVSIIGRHSYFESVLYKVPGETKKVWVGDLERRALVKVKVRKKLIKDRFLYDLSVDKTHRYFAQHYLVHNTEHAFARGEELKNFERFMEVADVIHFNTIPAEVKFGSGLDRHSNTSINESKGISPDQLKKWLVRFSHKIKILEMYSDTSTRTFHELKREVDNGEFAKKFLYEVS